MSCSIDNKSRRTKKDEFSRKSKGFLHPVILPELKVPEDDEP